MDKSNNIALLCTICNNYFNQINRLPRMIPDCGHSYCEECIWKNVINSKHTFKCPEDGYRIQYLFHVHVQDLIKRTRKQQENILQKAKMASNNLRSWKQKLSIKQLLMHNNNQQIVLCSRDSINNFPKNISIIKIMQHHSSNQKIDSFGVMQQKPFQMAEVVSSKSFASYQSFTDKNQIPSSQESRLQLTPQKYSLPRPQQCQIHSKVQDLGCLQCQEKICSHCAIFGNHKNHTVIPEDEMKKRNKNGLEQMVSIKHKINYTKEDFIRKMEDIFQHNICNKIDSQKNSFKQSTRHKFQEFLKLLEYQEQKCYDEIEKFFQQVEEKFRKFKNHSFKETYDKIYNWNQMVDTVRSQQEGLEKINQVDFDLFLHLEKLLIAGNDLEIEYNNLLQFPQNLIENYLDNISFSFSDSIKTNIENCMSIQFLHNESDVIHKSIEHLTFENQKEILSNQQFFQLTPLEIRAILGTTNQTPTQQFLQSQQAISNKQSMKASQQITSRKNSLNSESSRQSSQGSRFKSKLKENVVPSIQKAEVSMENVDTIVAELSSYRQKNIIPQLKESSLNKDRMLISNLDNQVEFMKQTQTNGSMYNSVVINSNESDRQHQIYQFFTDADSISRAHFDNNSSNGMLIVNQMSNSPQLEQLGQNISDIQINGSGFFKKVTPSVHDNCKFQAILEKQFTAESKKSQMSQSDVNPLNRQSKIDTYSSQQRSIMQTPLNKSRSRSPFRVTDIEISHNQHYDLQNGNLEIKSARSHYTNTDMYGSRDNNSFLKKSLTPQKKDRIVDSQIIDKSKISNYNHLVTPYQNFDLSKTMPSRATTINEDTYSTYSLSGSNLNSNTKQIKKNLNTSKNNSLKFIKSPTKSIGGGKSNMQQSSPISQRKSSANAYKKKSEKLQIILSKLRQNEYLDILELVSEDVNDQECEELGAEIGKTKQTIDSIKLVKNKITDIGLKCILNGLEKSNQKIHTLNLTSNQCSENCFDDILKYIQKNSNLKNIYLLNNSIQTHKNKDKLKSIQQLCNIHI